MMRRPIIIYPGSDQRVSHALVNPDDVHTFIHKTEGVAIWFIIKKPWVKTLSVLFRLEEIWLGLVTKVDDFQPLQVDSADAFR